MPIKIPTQPPATETLTQENIFVMTETRAITRISGLCKFFF